MDNEPDTADSYKEVESRKNVKLNIADLNNERVVIFHKKDQINVLQQQIEKVTNSKMRLIKPPGAVRSTVVLDEKILEILWKD